MGDQPDEIQQGRDRPRRPSRRRLTPVLLVVAVAAAASLLGALWAASGTPRHRAVGGGSPTPASSPPLLLRGVRSHSSVGSLLLGGSQLWRLTRQGLTVVQDPLLEAFHRLGPNTVARQVLPVPGGAVALIANETSSGPDIGDVVFIPSGGGRLRLLTHATTIAVASDANAVWVQQTGAPLGHGPRSYPTWAVDLVGHRHSAVLHLPGQDLVGVSSVGLITDSIRAGLQLVNPVTGAAVRLPIPASALFIETGRDRVVWQSTSCGIGCPLRITDVRTGTSVVVALPRNRVVNATPLPSGFDRTGQRLVIPLAKVEHEVASDQDLFVVDETTRTVTRVPGGPLPALPEVILTGTWTPQGAVAVLARGANDEFEVAYWLGSGPLNGVQNVIGDAFDIASLGTD